MNLGMHKKAIQKKTFLVSSFTLLSRILGTLREFVTTRFLSFGLLSDAFITAFRIPNFLRKIFAEGALSAAIVPSFTKIFKEEGIKKASSFLTLSFLFFEGITLLLSVLVFYFSEIIVKVISPGFSAEQISATASFLKILFPLIFFISGSSLIAAALQSVNHFTIPAAASSILNIAWIVTVILGLAFNWPIESLCFGILVGGLILFIAHLVSYFKNGFSIELIDESAVKNLKGVLHKFAPSLLGVGIMELNLFIDQTICSYLPQGSVSTIYYGTRFMQIPLSVFATAFSTVLLTHFSRVALYAPKRIQYYILESIKLVCWIIIPATFFLMFISENLFSILLYGKNVSYYDIWQASRVLIIMSSGLIFASLNKILQNVFYAFHDTKTPTVLGAIAAIINLCGNLFSLFCLGQYAIFGIAASTVLSTTSITILSFYFLYKKYNFKFYSVKIAYFIIKYIPQILMAGYLFWITYTFTLEYLNSSVFSSFFKQELGYWICVLPIGLLAFVFLFFTKPIFKIKLYFLN